MIGVERGNGLAEIASPENFAVKKENEKTLLIMKLARL
jgi:hypothetical protein